MNQFTGNPAAWHRAKLEALLGKVCFGGLDIGKVNDFTCLALYFPKQKGVPVPVLLLWAWVPKDVDCHKLLKERYGYQDWVDSGFLQQMNSPVTDFKVLRLEIEEINRRYQIMELAYDPYYAAELVQNLIAEGLVMVEHRQGTVSMTGPIQEFQRQIIGRGFVHGMNPLLTFMVDNLVVKSDGKGNLTCVKPGNPNSPRKIDGAVAAIMATGRAAANPDACGDDSKFSFV